MFTGITTVGETAKWAILCVGLFCSVMWSNIFSLAIEGLGPLKSQASSLLIIAIAGGALLPRALGEVADRWGIQYGFVVPMLAFAYIAFYGIYGYRAGRQLTATSDRLRRLRGRQRRDGGRGWAKSEIRNPKSETNSKHQGGNDQNHRRRGGLEH